MSAPLLTWNFEATSDITGVLMRTSFSRPVDAKLEDMLTELAADRWGNPRLISKEWERWAWPGGYPLYYVCLDGGVLCSKCANKEIELTSAVVTDDQWAIGGVDINWEDPHLVCDHCGECCESAYAEPDTDDSDDGAALASAGHGTDEDYGSAGDML